MAWPAPAPAAASFRRCARPRRRAAPGRSSPRRRRGRAGGARLPHPPGRASRPRGAVRPAPSGAAAWERGARTIRPPLACSQARRRRAAGRPPGTRPGACPPHDRPPTWRSMRSARRRRRGSCRRGSTAGAPAHPPTGRPGPRGRSPLPAPAARPGRRSRLVRPVPGRPARPARPRRSPELLRGRRRAQDRGSPAGAPHRRHRLPRPSQPAERPRRARRKTLPRPDAEPPSTTWRASRSNSTKRRRSDRSSEGVSRTRLGSEAAVTAPRQTQSRPSRNAPPSKTASRSASGSDASPSGNRSRRPSGCPAVRRKMRSHRPRRPTGRPDPPEDPGSARRRHLRARPGGHRPA